MISSCQLPIIADRAMGLPGNLWPSSRKSGKTEKAAGVFGCGKSEDVLRIDAEMGMALTESKAFPQSAQFAGWIAVYHEPKLLINRTSFYSRSRARLTLG
jgi:hypothetical protein